MGAANPLVGVQDAVFGGHVGMRERPSESDARPVDGTPAATAGILIGAALILIAMKAAGFKAIIGVSGGSFSG